MAATSPTVPLRWWPIPRGHQVLFAEALAQALDIGIGVVEAMELAAEVNPGRRFRAALAAMIRNCRRGYPLEGSLALTGARVAPGLLAALRVGEERGCLASELAAFARGLAPRAPARLARSVGRRAEAARFAACLARLLADRRLTPDLIRDAGRVASAGRPGSVFERLARGLEDGQTFPSALDREPRTFDPLFRRFVRESAQRDHLRAILSRLGDGGPDPHPLGS